MGLGFLILASCQFPHLDDMLSCAVLRYNMCMYLYELVAQFSKRSYFEGSSMYVCWNYAMLIAADLLRYLYISMADKL